VTSSEPKDPESALGTWNTTAVADRAYWLRLKVTDCLVDAVGATPELINNHTRVLYRMIWVENGYPQISLGVQYAYLYRTSGAVCNWIKPALLCKYGHLKRDVAEGVEMSFRLRYEEAAQHPNQLVGPKDRTQAHRRSMDQLADGSYRGVSPISDLWPSYCLLSCAYHNGNWTLSTDGQPVQYTWYDGARSASPAAVTVEHKNLLIKAVSPEYIIFNPESSSTVGISYTLEKLMTENCTVTIKIYTSAQALVRTLTLQRTCSAAGSSYTETWDGKDGKDENGKTVPTGLYSFAIDATASNGDADQTTSESLTITSTAVQALSYDSLRVACTLSDTLAIPASTAWVDVYDPSFGLAGHATGPTALGEQTTDVTVARSDEAGFYVAVAFATDGAAAHDKGHRARQALPRNSRIRQYMLCVDPGHGGTYEQVVAYCDNRHCCDTRPVIDGYWEPEMALDVAFLIFCETRMWEWHAEHWPPHIWFARPVVTRYYNEPKHLWQRVQTAAKAKCDAFVSLHSNASGEPSTRGHANEWCPRKPSPDHALATSVNDQLNIYVPEIPQHDIGVYQDINLSGFHVYVLDNTYRTDRKRQRIPIPATLAELGYGTNATDRGYLQDDWVRKRLAWAVLRGVEEFLLQHPSP